MTLEFGEALEPGGGCAHGRWHLWIYGSAWRLDGDDLEHWMLYLPGGDVLTAGPGTSWSLERGGQPGA